MVTTAEGRRLTSPAGVFGVYGATSVSTLRADYDGTETPHTKNGTQIDLADDIGIQTATPGAGYVFEAGWAPTGAVCVAHTRWGDLLTLKALLKTAPRLGGRCDEAAARRRGAPIYTRAKG